MVPQRRYTKLRRSAPGWDKLVAIRSGPAVIEAFDGCDRSGRSVTISAGALAMSAGYGRPFHAEECDLQVTPF